MYKYEDTEQTLIHLQMDGRTDKVKPVYPPFNFVEVGGIIKHIGCFLLLLGAT